MQLKIKALKRLKCSICLVGNILNMSSFDDQEILWNKKLKLFYFHF